MAEPAENAGTPRPLHLQHVEGLRAAAALIVYFNHAYAQCWNPLRGTFPTGILSVLSYSLIAGHLSVTIFIVISGFCLALPVLAANDTLRGGAVGFFKRRARRILPPYYGAVALCLALIGTVIGEPTGTFWDVPIMVTRTSIVSHLLMVQDLFATGSINYVLWSIAVEWQIYFLFPALVVAWRRFGAWRTLSSAFVIGYCLRVFLGHTRIARAHPHYLGMFVLGMFAAYVVQSPRETYVTLRQRVPWVWLCSAGLITAMTLTVVWGISAAIERFYLLDVPIGIMAASLLVLSSAKGSAIGRVFAWKPIAVVGGFSYSFYLIHAPLLQILWKYVLSPSGAAPPTMLAFYLTAGLAVNLAAAYLFYLALEAPFLRKVQRRVAAPVPAALVDGK